MTEGIQPITDDERHQRLARAQELMGQQGIAGMVLEPGSSLYYFTGMRWGLSERPFVGVVPAKGELAWVCPAFEEARARELIRFGKDVRVWQEDDSPYEVIAGILRDRGAASGKVAVEERVRFFVMDGTRQALPGATWVSATPITAGCRMFKSATEIALMQRANDITVAGMKAAFATLAELADCLGAVIYDPTNQIMMVTHLGRHSIEMEGGIKSVQFLVDEFGSEPADLQIWLSPAVDVENYPLFAFENRGLLEVAYEQFIKAGVGIDQIEASDIDTATDDNYFSHSEYLAGNQMTDGRFAIDAMMRD